MPTTRVKREALLPLRGLPVGLSHGGSAPLATGKGDDYPGKMRSIEKKVDVPQLEYASRVRGGNDEKYPGLVRDSCEHPLLS